MAEFCVYPEQLKAQANRLDDVASSITATQIKVAAAVSGLGPIGLAEVGPNILAIEARLLKHKMTVQSMSEALMRIKQRFELAEATIQGEVLQYIIDQIIEGVVDGISSFIDGVSDWVDNFIGMTNGIVGDLPGLVFDFLDQIAAGGFSGEGLPLMPGFVNDFLSSIGIDNNWTFLQNDWNIGGIAQFFDENGVFEPGLIGVLTGEGSIFSLDSSWSPLSWLSGENHLTIGEYNIGALINAGIVDEHGNFDLSRLGVEGMLDLAFTGIHDQGAIHITDFYSKEWEIKYNDILAHAGAGVSLTELGAAAYVTGSRLEISSTDRFGLDWLNVFKTDTVTVGSVFAGAGIDAGLFSADGSFNPHFFVGEGASASALSVSECVGINLGGIELSGGIAVDVGAAGESAFVYMNDGKIVANIGLDDIVGGSLVLQADVSPIIDGVNYVTSGEAWDDFSSTVENTYDYVVSGDAWDDFASSDYAPWNWSLPF